MSDVELVRSDRCGLDELFGWAVLAVVTLLRVRLMLTQAGRGRPDSS